MKCFKKIERCNNQKCGNEIIECDQGSMCHALIDIINKNKTNTTDMIESIDYEIHSAGCWSGNDECLRPIDFVSKFNSSTYIHGDFENAFQIYHDRNYTIPSSLLESKYQNSCIVYSADKHDHIFMKKYNKRYCCCSTELCNQNIIYTLEKNPYVSAFDKTHSKQIISTRKPPNDIYHYNGLTIGLTFLLIFLLIGIIYKFRREIKKYLRYFYKNSLNDRMNSSSMTNTAVNYNTQSDIIQMNENSTLNIPQSHAKQAIINDYLNNNTASNSLNLQQTQPLLIAGANGSVIPSSVVAPNANILPSDIFRNKDSNIVALSNTFLPNHNLYNTLNHFPTSTPTNVEFSELMHIQENVKENNELPKCLQPVDLNLISKVASGQFSSVWKAICKSSQLSDESKDKEQVPLYAVKVFPNQNKSAWQNEKDIYNCLHTVHENILRYYGAYVHQTAENNNSKNAHDMFMFNLNLNEYWLITELHEIGSLYDFLKANFLTYPQMINLCHSILEGLAYLHSDNMDSKKSFAIAHRDLKSKNILVKNDGNTCCIGDFGLALRLNNSNKLNSAEIRSKVGTRRYMSPELIEGAIVFTKETFLSKYFSFIFFQFQIKKFKIYFYAS